MNSEKRRQALLRLLRLAIALGAFLALGVILSQVFPR
jgi:hypothetical protein